MSFDYSKFTLIVTMSKTNQNIPHKTAPAKGIFAFLRKRFLRLLLPLLYDFYSNSRLILPAKAEAVGGVFKAAADRALDIDGHSDQGGNSHRNK